MENTDLIPLQYALDTFYFVHLGALVMWMAAGFAMLEAGLVRAKNTTEILTKNVTLYAVACVMYMLVGYHIMYSSPEGGFLPSLGFLIGDEHAVEVVAAGGADAPDYSARADFFFQVVFVATAMSIVSGAVAERMKLWAFLAFAVVMTGFIYPVQGFWKWGSGFLNEAGFLDFAGSGVVHLCGASAALAGVLLLGARRGKSAPTADQRHPRRQPAAGVAGHLHPLAGLVRLQRRLAAEDEHHRGRQRGGQRLPQHQHGGGRRPARRAGLRPPAVRQGRPDHGPRRRPGRSGGDHRRAGGALDPRRDPDRCGRRGAGGGRRGDPRQAEDRRPGRRHLGPRPGRDLGSAGGAAEPTARQLRRPAARHRLHLRLGVRRQPGGVGHPQGGDRPARRRRGGIHRRGHRRVRHGGPTRSSLARA